MAESRLGKRLSADYTDYADFRDKQAERVTIRPAYWRWFIVICGLAFLFGFNRKPRGDPGAGAATDVGEI